MYNKIFEVLLKYIKIIAFVLILVIIFNIVRNMEYSEDINVSKQNYSIDIKVNPHIEVNGEILNKNR